MKSDDLADEVQARLAESVTLCVGRLVDGGLDRERLAIDAAAADALRAQAVPVVGRLRHGGAVRYTAGNEIEDDEYFLVDDAGTLEELAPFRILAAELGSMPVARPADLDASVGLTVTGFGDDDASRIVAVQKADPRLTHRGGRFFALGSDVLHLLEEPVFAFSPTIDFLVGPDWAVVLRQRPFEALLRHVSQVEQRIGGWVESITTHIPMDSKAAAQLREVAMRDSRTWRRLREIHQRGHLAHVTIEQVKGYAARVGLDVNRVVHGDKLVFDPVDRFGFLHLLNEDLYRGPLTDDVYEAQRKMTAD
jgi:hypothetical protein